MNIKTQIQVLVLIFPLFSFANKIEVDLARYEKSVLDLQTYQSFVNDTSCRKTYQHFLGCVDSINTLLLGLAEEQGYFEMLPATGDRAKKGTLLKSFNFLALVDLREVKKIEKETPRTKMALQEKFETFRKIYVQTFQLYSQKETSEISEIINFVTAHFKSKLKKILFNSALNSYLQIAADPHSGFELYKSFVETSQSSVQQTNVGIGSTIDLVAEGILLVEPDPGSGVLDAGLRSGDILLSVKEDGVETDLRGVDIHKASAKLRGKEGSEVKVRYLRESHVSEAKIIRKKIELKVVRTRSLQLFNKTLGYVKLGSFSFRGGCELIKQELLKFNSQNVEGLILDLRGNGGGNLNVVICMAGLFLGPHKIMSYIVHNQPPIFPENLNRFFSTEIELKKIVSYSTQEEKIFDKQMVVLIDEFSASGSELLAQGLRDHNRALLVGKASFGKGSAQDTVLFSDDMRDIPADAPLEKIPEGSLVLWATTGLFYSPSGLSNQGSGVVPHLEASRQIEPKLFEQQFARESDRYMFPIEQTKLRLPFDTSWMNQLKVPKDCVESKNPKSVFLAMPQNEPLRDFQILNGAAALACGF